MVEAKKATATKTKSCYAVTRQAGIAEKLAGRHGGKREQGGNISTLNNGETTVTVNREMFPYLIQTRPSSRATYLLVNSRKYFRK